MLNKYKSIIWDWNGTLLNDVDTCVQIINSLLQQHNGKPLSKNKYQDTFGFPIADYYRRIGISFEKESFEELTQKFMGEYMRQVKSCALHDRTLPTLTALRQKAKDQFILTAAHKDNVLDLLDHYGIRHYFKDIEGLDNFRAESKVERGHQLLKNNNIDPKKAVLIGDTIHDYHVAMEIGVDCILVADGHQSLQRLRDKTNHKTPVISNLDRLIGD